MIVWLDNHLSPALAAWIEANFGVSASQVRDFGMARASDPEIFNAARAAGAVVITKDWDFVEIVRRPGPPPAIILLSVGNTSTRALKAVLADRLATALAMIEAGESLVEIGG